MRARVRHPRQRRVPQHRPDPRRRPRRRRHRRVRGRRVHRRLPPHLVADPHRRRTRRPAVQVPRRHRRGRGDPARPRARRGPQGPARWPATPARNRPGEVTEERLTEAIGDGIAEHVAQPDPHDQYPLQAGPAQAGRGSGSRPPPGPPSPPPANWPGRTVQVLDGLGLCLAVWDGAGWRVDEQSDTDGWTCRRTRRLALLRRTAIRSVCDCSADVGCRWRRALDRRSRPTLRLARSDADQVAARGRSPGTAWRTDRGRHRSPDVALDDRHGRSSWRGQRDGAARPCDAAACVGHREPLAHPLPDPA